MRIRLITFPRECTLQRGGANCLPLTRAALESVRTDEWMYGGHGDANEPTAPKECKVPDVDERVGQRQLCQPRASLKCLVPDVDERVGQCHLLQPSAFKERAVPDVGECVGQCHHRQSRVSMKRTEPNVGECVGQCHFPELQNPCGETRTNSTNLVDFVGGKRVNNVHQIGLVFANPSCNNGFWLRSYANPTPSAYILHTIHRCQTSRSGSTTSRGLDRSPVHW